MAIEEEVQKWGYPEIIDNKLTKYNFLVQYSKNLSLGHRTDIGAFTYINAKNGVVIGDHVKIGSHCSIYSVSTIDDKEGQVKLSRGCRIGTHTTIMPGVTIGENAIIGAHSYVTCDIPDDAVAFGVPAKVVKAP